MDKKRELVRAQISISLRGIMEFSKGFWQLFARILRLKADVAHVF